VQKQPADIVGSATQLSVSVALAGQTRGAIWVVLELLVTFSFKRKSDKQIILN